MIDLHSHVLPGVDDGARDLAEAIAMCTMAAEDGCTAIVATPHQRHAAWANDDCALLADVHATLTAAVGDRIAVLLGAEVHVDSELLAAVEAIAPAAGQASSFRSTAVLALAGQRSLLLELDRLPPRGHDPIALIHELLVAGWLPILAHPEFIPWLAADPDLMADLVGRGAWFQVTAMSLTGDFGRGPRDLTTRMVADGLVQVVASDCHGTLRRPPGLSRAHLLLETSFGEDVANLLTTINPARALGIEHRNDMATAC
jgi:protein-tyrosine phosphatase